MTDTPLDAAHRAMEDTGADADRLRFYERLADGELFVLLSAEAEGDRIDLDVFEVDDQKFALVFDREERLSAFADGPAPYASLSGRVLAGMLAGQGIGLGVNLGVAPSSILLPADAVDWLADTVANAPDRIEARPEEIMAPVGLPEALITGLDTKLAASAGLARAAYLVAVRYDTGARGHMLAFIDPLEGADGALSQAVAEALTFSNLEAGSLDVAFFAASDSFSARLAKVGLRFDLPQPETEQVERVAPGSDPEKPPILR